MPKYDQKHCDEQYYDIDEPSAVTPDVTESVPDCANGDDITYFLYGHSETFSDEALSNQTASPGEKPAIYQGRVKQVQLYLSTRQLATLLRAGLPLVPALSAIAEQLEGKPLAGIFRDVRDRINSGSCMADALENYPSIFTPLYVNMVRTGQAGGTLEDILFKLADAMAKRSQLTAKIKASLTYPLFMAVTAIAVVFFLITFVIPGISKIFLDMNRQLPWVTSALISLSGFLRANFLYIFLTLGAAIIGLSYFLKSQAGKLWWDRHKLKLPLLGSIWIKVEATRLTRTLGILLTSGISFLQALKIVKGVIQNNYIAEKLDGVTDDIGKGKTVSGSIKKLNIFSPILHHTIAIGEMSGNLEEQLINIADAYDQEIELQLRSLTSLLEPIIMLMMGLVVGFIVLALLLPIFEINQMF